MGSRTWGSVGRKPGLRAGLVWIMASATLVSAQRGPVPLPRPSGGGVYEASGVAAISGTTAVLFVDNTRPKHVFWTEFDAAGRQLGNVVPVALGLDVPDLEDIATDGRYFYVVGSQSQGGGRRSAGLVRFMFDNRARQATGVEAVNGLEDVLTGAVPALRSGRGRGRGRGSSALNIEGLVWDAPRSRLLLGLRSPLSDEAAVVVPLAIRNSRAPFTAENLEAGSPIRLMLGGLAIRGLGFDPASKHVLVIAGASTFDDAQTFRLLDWDGVSATPGRQLATFAARDKPEGVAVVTIGGRPRTLVVFDTGGYQLLD